MVAQAIARQVYFDARSFATLRALGMKRSELALAGSVRSGLIVAAGVLGAVAVAVLLSPTMPIGFGTSGRDRPRAFR